MSPQKFTSKLSASIVLYNTPEHLLRKPYDSIIESGLAIELILVDNSPVPCIEPSKFPFAHYTFTGRNAGYGQGHNIAIREIINSSTYHFVLNPDISFPPETLPTIIEFMDSDVTIGQVMPRVEYPDGEIQYLCKLVPTPWDLLVRRFSPSFLKPILKAQRHRFELRETGYQTTIDVPFLSGCFMALRVEGLKKVGLFDERFFMYAEDIDLTRRIAELYRTTYFPSVKITHDHARESYQNHRMLWIHIKNLCIYFNKWGWIFDKQRKRLNQRTLQALVQMKGLTIKSKINSGD
jgi:hypothetical protein